jgi:hypothetical protein
LSNIVCFFIFAALVALSFILGLGIRSTLDMCRVECCYHGCAYSQAWYQPVRRSRGEVLAQTN